MEKRISTWLKKYGKTYRDPDFGYSDVEMIDGCMYDLGLSEDARALVGRMVDAWIVEAV